MKIKNAEFKARREAFTKRLGIGINASRKLLADDAGLRSIQRIIDYETDPEAGAGPLVVKALANCMSCPDELVKPEDIAYE